MVRRTEVVSRPGAFNGHEPAGLERDSDVAPDASEPEFVSFDGVFKILWRQRSAVALCLLAGLTISGVVYALQPKMYQARTTLEIQLPNDDYLNHRQFDPSQGPGPVMIEPFLQTQLRLLQNDALVLQAAGKLDLVHAREFRPKTPWWQYLVPASILPANLAAKPPAELARGPFLEILHERLDARILGDTEIVEITFESQDAKLAAQFVNTLAAEYQKLSLSRQ